MDETGTYACQLVVEEAAKKGVAFAGVWRPVALGRDAEMKVGKKDKVFGRYRRAWPDKLGGRGDGQEEDGEGEKGCGGERHCECSKWVRVGASKGGWGRGERRNVESETGRRTNWGKGWWR